MTRKLMSLAVALVLAFMPGTAARAQPQDAAPVPTAAVPLSVEVTISRYQGDELVDSLPYMLSVTTGSRPSTLRFNDRVPVPVGPPAVGPDGVARHLPFNYEIVGTRIESQRSPHFAI